MILLKTSCLEDNEVAHHTRHYGMRVLKQGFVTQTAFE